MNRTRRAVALCLAIAAGAMAAGAASSQEKSGLASLDANGDHAISRQEAANAQVATFKRMDKNDNGVLSRDELKASRPPPAKAAGSDKAAERARAQAIDRWFANLDTDNSSDISLAEYQAAMTPYFDRLDANGDGVIGGGELRRAYTTDEREQRGATGK